MKKIISFAMVIATLLSITTVAYAKVGPFEDVNSNAYYAEAVQWAYENGVTSGTSSTTFSPNSTCTRGQVVTFLWNMNGKPKVDIQNPFIDVTADKYYHNAVLWAYQQGIVAGTSATTFSPDNTCTKEHILVMLWRSLGSPKVNNVAVNCSDWSKDAVMWAQSSGVAVGINGKDNCPRADIIYYMHNVINMEKSITHTPPISHSKYSDAELMKIERYTDTMIGVATIQDKVDSIVLGVDVDSLDLTEAYWVIRDTILPACKELYNAACAVDVDIPELYEIHKIYIDYTAEYYNGYANMANGIANWDSTIYNSGIKSLENSLVLNELYWQKAYAFVDEAFGLR